MTPEKKPQGEGPERSFDERRRVEHHKLAHRTEYHFASGVCYAVICLESQCGFISEFDLAD